jgi:hypothetical protein
MIANANRRCRNVGSIVAIASSRSSDASCSLKPFSQVTAFRLTASVTRLFMAGQAHSALGTAKIVTGDVHHRKAIWRIDQTAPEGRYTLDNAGRISEMRDRAFTEAREQIPELRRHFFGAPAEEFVPFYVL